MNAFYMNSNLAVIEENSPKIAYKCGISEQGQIFLHNIKESRLHQLGYIRNDEILDSEGKKSTFEKIFARMFPNAGERKIALLGTLGHACYMTYCEEIACAVAWAESDYRFFLKKNLSYCSNQEHAYHMIFIENGEIYRQTLREKAVSLGRIPEEMAILDRMVEDAFPKKKNLNHDLIGGLLLDIIDEYNADHRPYCTLSLDKNAIPCGNDEIPHVTIELYKGVRSEIHFTLPKKEFSLPIVDGQLVCEVDGEKPADELAFVRACLLRNLKLRSNSSLGLERLSHFVYGLLLAAKD